MAKGRRKVWKVDTEGKAGMEVTSETASMVVATAGHPNAIKVGKEGVWISGPISILTSPEEIRVGGFWVQNTPFLQMMPSTMATPIPNLILNPPFSGIANMAEAVAWAMTFLV
jgi:hypothetical protein